MPTDATIDLRPRTAGEVLDDAWRLALADAPLLLALSGLFAVPAVVALLLLLTRPAPASLLGQCAAPALAALLLPLTGVGSGACQELLRRRAAGERVTLGACLRAALRRAPQHAAGRALTLLGVGLGGLVLALPGLALWVSLGTLSPLLATGDGRLFAALGDAARDARRQPAKGAAVVLSRLPLVLITVVNLHLLVLAALWVAGSLAGLEVAFLDFLLSPGNPAYLVALVALAWLALAPYLEASSFLLHLDHRVRYDGFDLALRVRELFPAFDAGRAAALALAGLLLAAAPARADGDDPDLQKVRDTVSAVRDGVSALRDEVKAADPYPGGGRYQKRLEALGRRLKDVAPDAARWYDRAVEGFAGRDREGALEALGDLEQKLTLLLESLQPPEGEAVPRRSPKEIREALPGAGDDPGAAKEKSRREKEREQKDRVRPDDPVVDAPPRAGGGRGAVAPQAGGGGFGALGYLVLGGLALAVLAVALVLFLRHRERAERAPAPAAESLPAPDEPGLQPDEQSPAELWRRAEALARRGEFLEAVRQLYLAVLTQLHRADLIRYERTRTNGEYLRQLRAADAAAALVEPFRRLTRLFELKWYGERACAADDYDSCRELASQVREGAAK